MRSVQYKSKLAKTPGGVWLGTLMIAVSTSRARNVLMKAIKPETRVVESLKGLSSKLLPIIDSYDYQN